MNAIRMEVRLRNGKKITHTYDQSEAMKCFAGPDFRKQALKQARDANTTILWDSLKVEAAELQNA